MAVAAIEPTYQEIAERAYEISQSQECGSDEENWWRAERELVGQRSSSAPARLRRRSKAAAGSAEESPAAMAVAKLKGAASKRRSTS